MENTVLNQENVTENVKNQEIRTFSQDEVNEIVQARIAKERSRFADYETLQQKASKFDEMEEANKSELQKATEKVEALQHQIEEMNKINEVREMREKVSRATGVPASLIFGENEDECTEQANAILAYKNDIQKYPIVKDGGETQNIQQKKNAADQFADWFAASLNN